MSAAVLSARQLAETLQRIAYQARGRLTPEEWDHLAEAIRRLKQHEQLVHDVLPNLRDRLTQAEKR
jgi:hypothetical protein